MRKIGKKIFQTTSKAGKKNVKQSAQMAGAAAITGAKAAVSSPPEVRSFSDWMVRMVTNLPKYLRLYMALLTDNRVDHKAKAGLVTAVAVIGTHYAFGGVLLAIQGLLSVILGPLAFAPTILLMLLTLDICYKFIDSDACDRYEKKIFGEENSVQVDIVYLKSYLGDLYDRAKEAWSRKTDAHCKKMEEGGYIINGEFTDEMIQETADTLLELETSESLQTLIDKEVKRLKKSDREGQKALKAFTENVIGADMT